MIILDTCVLLWLVADQEKLSDLAIETIRKNKGMIYLSAISAFEIAIKVEKKKLKLPRKTVEWFELALRLHGIKEIPINSEILMQSVQLPSHHADPADRIIIATAKYKHLMIITPDEHVAKYRSVKTIW